MALTKATYSMIDGAVANILDYGAVADYNENVPGSGTDNSAAIQAAINAVAARSTYNKGAVFIPAGAYKILTALTVPYGVSIFGEGGTASVLFAENCNGMDFTSYGYAAGSMFFQDFGLTATAGSNYAAVTTVTNASTMDGLIFSRVRLYGWDQGFIWQSNWECTIDSCVFYNVNRCVWLSGSNGQTISIRITNNRMTYGTGGAGAADKYAIDMNNTSQFTESVHIVGNKIFGYQRNINAAQATYLTIIDNDLSGSDKVIAFVTANGTYSICNNYIEVTSTGTGVYGAPNGSQVPAQRAIISGNHIIGTASAAIGIQLNDSGSTFQWNAVIRDNVITGFATWDMLLYNPGKTLVDANRCLSTATTNSIFIGDVNAGYQPVIFSNNWLKKAFQFSSPTNYADGNVVLQNNVENDTFQSFKQSAAPTTGTWRVTDVVMNSAPASGQPAGWVCTVAGTPGTWKAMANLA